MSGFYIKKVIAKSAVKGDASVTFGKGLTIIQGRSDSGKTCVKYKTPQNVRSSLKRIFIFSRVQM